MVDPTDPTKPPHIPPGPAGAESTHHKSPPAYGKATAQPMTWLGMHFTGPEAEKLWYSIMQQINTQIQHEQARSLKALRKLRKSSTGEGDD